MKKLKVLLTCLFVMGMLYSFAQSDSSGFKNTIHFNITNPLIFGERSLILGYERVLKHNQSLVVNLGSASYPKMRIINRDSLVDLEKDYTEKGLHASVEYRFYLSKENKYPAPRGVYVGPYYSYNYFNRINNWKLNSGTYQGYVESDFQFDIHSVGVELGYQFVFWKRLSVDMILIGPGVSFYDIKCDLSTSLSPEDQQRFYDALNEFLTNKIPGYSRTITGDGFQKQGSVKTTSLGYRYLVTVGFRF